MELKRINEFNTTILLGTSMEFLVRCAQSRTLQLTLKGTITCRTRRLSCTKVFILGNRRAHPSIIMCNNYICFFIMQIYSLYLVLPPSTASIHCVACSTSNKMCWQLDSELSLALFAGLAVSNSADSVPSS